MMQLTTTPNVLLWHWTADDQYTYKSCYDTLFQGAMNSSSWKLI